MALIPDDEMNRIRRSGEEAGFGAGMDRFMMGKRVVYFYTFNYHGGDTYEGRVVGGASMSLMFHVYRDGREVLFDDGDEICVNDMYLNDVYDVCFDRTDLFRIVRNEGVEQMFCDKFGWSRIDAEIVLYFLDLACGVVGDEKNDLPKSFQNVPVEEPVVVPERIWRGFVRSRTSVVVFIIIITWM